MTLDRKELYQKKSQEATIKLADFMMANSENGIVTMNAGEIRENLKFSIYLFKEASGRLKALGFHSGVIKFTKTELSSRQDNKVYHYKINPENHPLKLHSGEIDRILNQRQKVLKNKRLLQDLAFSLAFSHNNKMDSNS